MDKNQTDKNQTEKNWKEVFPGLKLGEEAESYFEEVAVTGITFWKNAGRLEVGIFSRHLIPKHLIREAEEAIRIYVFGAWQKRSVRIQEKYQLPDTYTTENLIRIYRDSFLEEIRDESYVDYKILKDADIQTDGDRIQIEAAGNIVSETRKEEIIRYLETVFQERFGQHVTVKLTLTRKKIPDIQHIVSPEKNTQTEPEQTPAESYQPEEHYNRDENMVAPPAALAQEEGRTGAGTDSSRKHREGRPSTDSRKNQEKYRARYRQDPECFYGKNTEGEEISIHAITEDTVEEIVIHGQVFGLEERQTRKMDKWIVTANLTDFTDSISFKVFVRNEEHEALMEKLHNGAFLKLKGMAGFDSWSREIAMVSVTGMKVIPDFRTKRMDEAEEKRTELHLHTVMSQDDSVLGIQDYLKRVIGWGWKSAAITDHGVAQAFPVAFHYLQDNRKTIPEDFKLIYGIEAYLVDDLLPLVMNPHGQSLDSDYVVFDIETTGLSFEKCRIIEIGAVRIDSTGKELGRFSEFINPGIPIPYHIQKLTSITDETVKNAPPVEVILPKFLEFARGAMLVAHNATFDTTFTRIQAHKLGLTYDFTALDTMTLAHILLPELGRYNLDRLTNYFKLKNNHHHRACDDADVTAKIFIRLKKMIDNAGMKTVDDLNEMARSSPDTIRKAKPYHGTILIQTEEGRVNLYRLISESHIQYFNRVPKIPMTLVQKYRKGLLLGSGCSQGELYQAILDGKEEEEIERIVRFFDYLEIQPCENNRDLIGDEKAAAVNSLEDLQDINRRILQLGKKYGKPVAATGDAHFLDPEDAIFRTIVQEGSSPRSSSKKKEADLPYGGADAENPVGGTGDRNSVQEEMSHQPPLYLHTTEEMLKCFEFLGPEEARDVVITAPNRIADMIDRVEPVRPDKCPPVIPNSDQTLRDICHKKAHEIYGPDLPKIVEERLEKELNSIIGNGYSVMYIIAQKLVWKSNADGYLVGSRGSVGSSFAATMAGITEVNPLPAHYLCPKCHFVDFDSEEVKKYSGMSGCDMPDRDCPVCGTKLQKMGNDIPFETFLGFKGDKEPDIDLNFSGEYQPRAHAFIEEIFGKGKAFRAGTIGTLAEKTAYGYALRYCETRGIQKRRAEIERLAEGCTGVKRTTGQHPGGIIVLPPDEEIYSFTPIQKPANDMTVDTITTHFEYHSIQQNLLKFDILGHDDPTMIRRLEDLTGLDATKIPLDDKNVMKMFQTTEPLGLTPEQIGGTSKSTLGIPEFGTDFAMQMLTDAKPQSFSDLVRIAGLAHGTDVWLGNAETLIKSGVCKLSSAICCRDDIMVYLMHMGLDPGEAFTIMERVRKGVVAKGKCKEWPQYVADMKAHGVPDWYIGSCEKIKYMFPKAHAVAYVMMAWRVAWFKLYHPLAYYTAFFSIRATAFNYEVMCQGEDHLVQVIGELRRKDKNAMTAKEQDLLRDCRIVQEMYERKISFMPIDIYKADATRFQIIDGKIMPSFTSIEGMGENAARQLAQAAKEGEFLSQKEIRDRAKISGTVLAKMAELGILGDLPEDNQLTFDFG